MVGRVTMELISQLLLSFGDARKSATASMPSLDSVVSCDNDDTQAGKAISEMYVKVWTPLILLGPRMIGLPLSETTGSLSASYHSSLLPLTYPNYGA